jgi:hypothetical protein
MKSYLIILAISLLSSTAFASVSEDERFINGYLNWKERLVYESNAKVRVRYSGFCARAVKGPLNWYNYVDCEKPTYLFKVTEQFGGFSYEKIDRIPEEATLEPFTASSTVSVFSREAELLSFNAEILRNTTTRRCFIFLSCYDRLSYAEKLEVIRNKIEREYPEFSDEWNNLNHD